VISISLETYCTSELADAVVVQEAYGFLFFVISISLGLFILCDFYLWRRTSELADAVVVEEAGGNGDVECGAALHLPDEVVARLPHSRRQADVLCTPGAEGAVSSTGLHI
jgi:hypothetical protein